MINLRIKWDTDSLMPYEDTATFWSWKSAIDFVNFVYRHNVPVEILDIYGKERLSNARYEDICLIVPDKIDGPLVEFRPAIHHNELALDVLLTKINERLKS